MYGGLFRYLGRQAIFPTQTFRLLMVLIVQFDVALKEDIGIDLQSIVMNFILSLIFDFIFQRQLRFHCVSIALPSLD